MAKYKFSEDKLIENEKQTKGKEMQVAIDQQEQEIIDQATWDLKDKEIWETIGQEIWEIKTE